MKFRTLVDFIRGRKKIQLIDSNSFIAHKQQQINNTLIKKIKNNYSCGKKINVGFLVVFDSVFPAKTIFELMLKDEIFNPFIIVIPDTSRGNENTIKQLEKTYNSFTKLYGKNVVINSYDKNKNNYKNLSSGIDIACIANPYDAMTHYYYRIEYLSQQCLIFYISYYYFGKLKYDLKFLKNRNLNKIWKIFIENKNSYNLFKKYLKIPKHNIIISGYPKMDEYNSFNETNDKPVIIISPHHTVRKILNHLNISNFMRLSDFYLRLPGLFPDIKFIFRPHPLLFITLSNESLWGTKKVNEYIESIKKIPNMEYQEGGEYLEAFAKSSALIHDCGSFLVEYLYTSHPQCFIIENKKVINREFLPFGKKILKNIYTASTEQNIIDFINEIVVKKNDYMKDKRILYAQKDLRYNYPLSSEFIFKNLKKDIIQGVTPPLKKNYESDEKTVFDKLIAVQGFYYSGSSSLIGLFQEFNNTTTLGMPDYVYSGKAASIGKEIRFFKDSFLFEYIKAYYSNDKIYQDFVIKNFISKITLCFKNKGLYPWDRNPDLYNDTFKEILQEFLFATLELDNKTKELAEKESLPVKWNSVDDKYKNYIFMQQEGIHQYIFYQYKKLTPEIFESYVKNLFIKFFNSIQSKEYLIMDQVFNANHFDYFIKYFEKPVKQIGIIRDPRDQFISAFRNNIDLLPRTVDDFEKFYLNRVSDSLTSKNPHRLVLRFEDLVLKYDESVQKIIDFVGIDKSCHIAPKTVFNPALSIVNIGGYKKFHNQDFMKQIEERLPEFCYYPEKENLSEEAWKMLKENNFKELE